MSNTIPRATRVAWAEKRQDIERSQPGITRHQFVYIMNRSSYEHDWGKHYDRQTVTDEILAFVLKLLPPVGPLRAVKLKIPTPPVEKLFMDSFNRSAQELAHTIDQANDNSLRLAPTNYDVGVVTPAGVYRLDDETHAYWLALLASKDFATVTLPIRSELLAYYENPEGPIATRKDTKKWSQLVIQIQELKAIAPMQPSVEGGQ